MQGEVKEIKDDEKYFDDGLNYEDLDKNLEGISDMKLLKKHKYNRDFQHTIVILVDKFERRGTIDKYTVVYNLYMFHLRMLNLNFNRPFTQEAF
jgi:hypothetical protein